MAYLLWLYLLWLYLLWQALFVHLQLLHAALPRLEGGVLPALLALFHDNRALCAAAPGALIHDLVRMHCADRPAPLGGANDAAVGPPSSALTVLDASPEQARIHTVAYTRERARTHAHPRTRVGSLGSIYQVGNGHRHSSSAARAAAPAPNGTAWRATARRAGGGTRHALGRDWRRWWRQQRRQRR
eukprot:scaffold20070_cov31-Phaeocystis_antarctica.AAC.1